MKKKFTAIIKENISSIWGIKILSPKRMKLEEINYNKGFREDAELFSLIEPSMKISKVRKKIRTLFFHKMFSFLTVFDSSK